MSQTEVHKKKTEERSNPNSPLTSPNTSPNHKGSLKKEQEEEEGEFVQHKFEKKHFPIPTQCFECHKLIWGLGYQGFHCKQCNLVAHPYCKEILLEKNECPLKPIHHHLQTENQTPHHHHTLLHRLAHFHTHHHHHDHYNENNNNNNNSEIDEIDKHHDHLHYHHSSQHQLIIDDHNNMHLQNDSLKHSNNDNKIINNNNNNKSNNIINKEKKQNHVHINVDEKEEKKRSFPSIFRHAHHNNNNNNNASRHGDDNLISDSTPLLPDYSRDVHSFFDVIEEIGKGSYSTVYKAQSKEDQNIYALKEIDNRAASKKLDIHREIKLIKQFDHPNIIKFKDIFYTEEKLYLITEYAAGGELFNRILEREHYSEKNASITVKHILEGVSYLHSRGVIHRDLKPENILLSTGNSDVDIKIADFGLATILNKKAMLHAACGTPLYSAPEVILSSHTGRGYGLESDMWSIGVITFILLCGYPPFQEYENIEHLFTIILKGKFTFEEKDWANISKEAKEFICKLLVLNPKKRMSANEALHHRWIVGDDHSSDHLSNTISSLRSSRDNSLPFHPPTHSDDNHVFSDDDDHVDLFNHPDHNHDHDHNGHSDHH